MARERPQLERDALGLGLRLSHYAHLFEHWPAVDYFEIISENFLGQAPTARQNLDRVRERYPIVLHGVGLNLLGHAPLDEAYLDKLCRLADHVEAAFVTDHLCWTGAHGMQHHDLLPTPYVPALVEFAAERAAYVQRRLGRPFGLENLSSYVTFRESSMSEWDFYATVVREAECWFMFDLNNLYVSSVNHGFDSRAYLSAIDFSRVLQVHLAGHTREPTGPSSIPTIGQFAMRSGTCTHGFGARTGRFRPCSSGTTRSRPCRSCWPNSRRRARCGRDPQEFLAWLADFQGALRARAADAAGSQHRSAAGGGRDS